MIKLYSDGACSGNPGPGAYGAILNNGEQKFTFCKSYILTTNNRMELLGIIEPIESLDTLETIEIYTDSQYVANALNKKWLENWVKNNWLKSDKKKVLNIDLWKRLLKLLEKHKIKINWIKGHGTNEMNNRCDRMATAAIISQSPTHDEIYEKSKLGE